MRRGQAYTMPPMTMRRRHDRLHAALLLAFLVSACGEGPERIGQEAPTSKPPAPAPASSEPRFEGRVVLKGTTEDAPGAAVFLSARRVGQRLPSLSRKYELRDPAWTKDGESRVLQFQLTDLDNMGGFGAPMATEMEIEARYDPDGMINTTPGAVDPGVVRAAVPATPGSKAVEVVLDLAAPK